MRGALCFATPTVQVLEGVRKSGDGRGNPNKLSWQVHDFVEMYRSYVQGEVLSSAFNGWLMGFPSGWADLNDKYIFSLCKEVI